MTYRSPASASISEKTAPRTTPLAYAARTVPVLLFAAFALYNISNINYLLFHTLAEGFGIVVATGMFMVAWHTHKYTDNDFLLFLGVVFQTVAVVDFMHTVTYEGMMLVPVTGADQATQYWIAARFLEAAALSASPFFLTHRVRLRYFIGIAVIIASATVLSVSVFKVFPHCFIEGKGLTPFKIAAEFVIIVLLAAAIFFLYRSRSRIDASALQLLSIAYGLTILSELCFMLYHSPYGFPNFAGHLLKIAGFFFIYRAIIAGTLEKPYASLFSDLTRTNTLLRNSEEHLRKMFDLTGVGKVEAEPATGRFLRFNSRFSKITGYTSKELPALGYADIIFSDAKSETDFPQQEKFENNRFMSFDTRIVRKNGSVIWVSISGTMVTDSNGVPLYSLADIIDINDRKTAEEQLQFHSKVLRMVEDMVIQVDHSETVTYINRRAAENYGITTKDAIGKKLSDLFYMRWESAETHKKAEASLRTSGRWSGELIQVKKNGTIIQVQATISRVGTSSKDSDLRLFVMNDISEKKEAEREIASLAKFPEENPYPVLRLDREGLILFANRPAREMLSQWGLQQGQTLDSKKNATLFTAVTQKEEQSIVELQAGTQWFSLAVVPVRDRRYVNIYGRDITQTRLYQEALQVSEQRYALAQSAANIGTWEWMIPAKKLHWSEQVEPMLGLKPGSFDGTFQSFLQLVHPDDRTVLSNTLLSCIRTQQDCTVEHRVILPNGSVRWMRESASAISTTETTPERLIGIITDITTQKREKQELEDKVQKQASVLEDTRVILEKVNTQKDAAVQQLQQRQHALEAIYKIITSPMPSLDDIADQVLKDIAATIGLDTIVFRRIEEGGTNTPIVRFENETLSHESPGTTTCQVIEQIQKTGTSIHHIGKPDAKFADTCPGFRCDCNSFLAVPVKSYQSEIVGVICVMRKKELAFEEYEEHLIDIFARFIAYEINRKVLESKMLQSREMHLLGQLTSGVAHEVRNPLNALMAISEALFKKLEQPEIYRQYMDHIRNQIRRLSRLMEDLLALGRPLRKTDFSYIDITTLLNDTLSDWIRIAPHRKEIVRIEPDASYRPVKVLVDNVKIQQVFINILDNAEHHSPPEGAIVISIANSDNKGVTIIVRDSGSGIPSADLDHLFDPFFTTRRAGTGLGLSIVKNTVENHCGSVRIFNNVPPPGASVEIYLPPADSSASASEEVENTPQESVSSYN